MLQALIWVFMVWGIGLVMFVDAVYRIGQDDTEAYARDAAAGQLVWTIPDA